MKKVEEKLQEVFKPGTSTRKACYALAFFVAGLLFVWAGFWQTLLIAALTLVGLYIGSSNSLVDSIKQLINKVFPPNKKPVTYSAEDILKVREAREQERKAKDSKEETAEPTTDSPAQAEEKAPAEASTKAKPAPKAKEK